MDGAGRRDAVGAGTGWRLARDADNVDQLYRFLNYDWWLAIVPSTAYFLSIERSGGRTFIDQGTVKGGREN